MNVVELSIGARTVAVTKAEKYVVDYTTRTDHKDPSAYPYYDTLRTGPAMELVDADFLAPTLLNAAPSIAGFASMQRVSGILAAALGDIPEDADLTTATNAEIEQLGALYRVLDDDGGLFDIRGTTLSKVLHRKRPAFIPLYDEHVRRCYQDGPDVPIPTKKKRPWSEFMVLLALAIYATTSPGSQKHGKASREDAR